MNRKIRHALAQPFPSDWRTMLADRLQWWRELDVGERFRLEDLVRVFLATKSFEGAAGFDPDEDATVTIAAEASLLVLGLGHEWYRDVGAIIVYPSTAVRAGRRVLDGGIESRAPVALSGEALLHGPVMIVWDAAVAAARHPERGHNVVHHEFAHKLDMADGIANGMPPLGSRDREREWRNTMDSVLARLRAGSPSVLDPYGAASPAELFAVATEAFFEIPGRLDAGLPEVYELLASFYQQDPAARHARATGESSHE